MFYKPVFGVVIARLASTFHPRLLLTITHNIFCFSVHDMDIIILFNVILKHISLKIKDSFRLKRRRLLEVYKQMAVLQSSGH